jgi:cytochrome P450
MFLLRDPPFVQRLVRKYGDIVCLRAGPMEVLVVGHPDLAREVLEADGDRFDRGAGTGPVKHLLGEGLLVSTGHIHGRQRRLVEPLLSREAVTAHADVVIEEAARVRDRWQAGVAIDVFDDMRDAAARVMIRVLGPDVNALEAERVVRALATSAASFWRLFLPFANARDRLLPRDRRFQQARATLDRHAEAAVERAGAERELPDGLLSRMLHTSGPEPGTPMSEAAAASEAINLLFGARAGAATGLTWAWHLLSEHPEVEARLQAELDEVLGVRPPTLDDLPALATTRGIFAESLRLFPPAWIMKREAVSDQHLNGYLVRTGASVLVCPYTIHRDARFHPEPTRFEPDRFTPDLAPKHPYVFFPFGGGPMKCVGDHFAWMEAPLVLATLAQRWRLRPAPGRAAVEASAVITLKPRGGLRMVPEPRQPAAGAGRSC